MKPVIVWHGHHSAALPLEFLNETFKSRTETINDSKSLYESPVNIARRLKLFKPVKGGLATLPKYVQNAWNRWQEASNATVKAYRKYRAMWVRTVDREAWEAYAALDTKANKLEEVFKRALAKAKPSILKLHKKQCGCGWTNRKRDIFTYKP